MRKFLSSFMIVLLTLILLSGFALPVLAEDEPVEITDKFADANFKAAVYALIGKTEEEPIYQADVSGIAQLNVSGKNIRSLAGIEYFTALTSLNCTGNTLQSLDLSSNTTLKTLDAQTCGLLSINLSKNTALETLLLGNGSNYHATGTGPDNVFTFIDLSKNTALKTLDLNHSWLTTLDISKNTKLETLILSDVGLAYLDVSKNTALKELHVNHTACDFFYGSNNKKLSSLNISNNPALILLDCSGQQINALDASKNAKLTTLDCSSNELISLNVDGCTALKTLDCSNNQLTALDVSHHTKLTTLSCESNKLASLDISGCTALNFLLCNDNQLTSLDVSTTPALKALNCSNNMMPLEPTGLENLTLDTYTFLPQNVAQAVDISDQFPDENFKAAVYEALGKEPGAPIYDFEVAALVSLDVSGREIASLSGIAYFTGLEVLNCSTNLLTELDLTYNTNLRELDCSHNLMLQPPTGIDPSALESYVFDPQDVKKPLSPILLIIGIVLLAALAGGGTFVWWTMQKKKKKKPTLRPGVKPLPLPESPPELSAPEYRLPEPSATAGMPNADLTSIFDRVSASEPRPDPVPTYTPEAKPVEDPFIARFQQSVSQKIKESEPSDDGLTKELR